MSNRRNNGGNRNRIRGPHSALTDFLAANNISASAIRNSHVERVRQAQLQGEGPEETVAGPSTTPAPPARASSATESPEAGPSTSRKRKITTPKSNSKDGKKVKLTKGGKKGKKGKKNDSDDDSDFDDDFGVLDGAKKSVRLPGQLENCEICSKRFTVTPYSKTGPEGGLVCTPCGKQLVKDSKVADKPKKAATVKRRRKVESDRLDGLSGFGAKSLQQLCIEKVVRHHEDIEEFGDLPETVMGDLSLIFTKNRVLKSETLDLFIRPDRESITIHDCAYLETTDYHKIIATVPFIEKIVLENACQVKDETVEYMAEKAQNLRFLQLYAANLVSDRAWQILFTSKGKTLEALKLQWLDASFTDESVEVLAKHCTDLKRLKFKKCRQLTDASLESIARLANLEHLSLQYSCEVPHERLLHLISSVGHNLETLSLEGFADAGDLVLEAIHSNCPKLKKLRFSNNDFATDAGYQNLFKNWGSTGLVFADFSCTRDMDNSNPDGPEDANGLASSGLAALMAHSGATLRHLDIASCRHITHATFGEVFDGEKQYPLLQEINVSFCTAVDTATVAGIFKCCPGLKKLVAFGCFAIEDVVVPAGIVLIGVPKAQDAIEQFGTTLVNIEQAVSQMAAAVLA